GPRLRAGRSPRPRIRPTAFEALTPASVAFAADPLDGQGVVVVGLGHVDEVPEDLVIPGRGDPELAADGCLLRSGATPPAPLEVEDGTIATREAHQARDPRLTGPPGQAFQVSDSPVRSVRPVPGAGPASSDDDAADDLAGLHGAERVVHLVEPDVARDHRADVEAARLD